MVGFVVKILFSSIGGTLSKVTSVQTFLKFETVSPNLKC
jgi:hypothetical protein